jgi:hypothetical protein
MDAQILQDYIEKNPAKKWMEDMRLPCLSEITHDNVTDHIIQYTLYYGKLMEKNAAISNYLDYGFIPVAFYPSCYASENERIDRMIEANGINVHKYPAIYAGDVRYRNAHTDSWVSRFDASGILGIPPEQLRTLDIINNLLTVKA